MLSEQKIIEAAKRLRDAVAGAGLKRTPGVYQSIMYFDAMYRDYKLPLDKRIKL